MRIIFWGTPELSVPSLEQLYHSYHQVIAVVTQPDAIQGRHHNERIASPIKIFAQNHQIPILQPESTKDALFLDQLRSLKPDIMVLVAYGEILSKCLLEMAPHGFLNVHFSLLPKYRGASPVAAAILAGEAETGISIIKLVPKLDAGPIYGVRSMPIMPEDTRGSLEMKLGQCAGILLIEVLENIEHGKITPCEQNHAQATYCRILQKQDGHISWEKEAHHLEQFIRAMSPWPGASASLLQKNKSEVFNVLLHKAEVIPSETLNVAPGTIIQVSKQGIDVATQRDVLRIKQLQKAGKKVLTVQEFLCGTPIQVGDTFFASEPS